MVSSFLESQVFSNTVVITLEKRKEYIKTVLTKMGINYTIFNAVLGKDLNLDDLVVKGVLDKNHTFKNANEVACYLSHIHCVENFSKSNLDTLFVFEDDISYKESAVKLVEKTVGSAPKVWEFINFGRCWSGCFGESKRDPKNPKLVKSSDFLCSHSYYLNKSCAKKIMESCFPAKYPLDIFYRGLFSSGKVISYASSPRIFEQRREQGKTSDPMSSNLDNNDSCIECISDAFEPTNNLAIILATIILATLLGYYFFRIKKFKFFSKLKV